MTVRLCLSTANTVMYPQGGHLWVFINWALGFRACGCEVSWLDVVSPDIPKVELRQAIQRLAAVLKPFGLDRSILVDYLTEDRRASTVDLSTFDLLFDLRWDLPEHLRIQPRRSALLDIDPGQLQFALVRGKYPIPNHNVFFSIGSAGTPAARFPDVGKTWIRTYPCVYLPEWPVVRSAPNAAWTTISHWWEKGTRWMVDGEGNAFADAKRDGFSPLYGGTV